MALSHSFAGEDVEHGGYEEADADRDHSDIEHDGSAPFKPSDAKQRAETRVGISQLI
jgi:hypothetical protein